MLAARGVTRQTARAEFLQPLEAQLHPAGALPGVDAAATRLLEAIDAGETIGIYGDYDVDGVTATATLVRVLRAIAPKARVETYIPDRRAEGFGMHAEAVRLLRRRGVDVLVTVDCGIASEAAHAVCHEVGMDLIITDHHPLGSHPIPDVTAVVHPGLPGSDYPWPILSGSAVAWKLARHLVSKVEGSDALSDAMRGVLQDTLCLAGMGVIADIVPLVGENRRIAAKALRFMRECTIPGVAALILECVKPGESITSETIGYRIGPRINAAGRLIHAEKALNLLLTDDDAEARAAAKELTEINTERQKLVRAMTDQASERVVAEGLDGPDKRLIMLADESWHIGVVGIVAAKLMNRFHRPTVLLGPAGPDVYRGSARTISEYPLHEAFEACSQHFVGHGGHAMAAGCVVATGDIPAATEAMLSHATANLPPEHLTPSLQYDCEVTPEDLQMAEVASLEALQPCGRDNETPRLLVRGLKVERARPVGGGDTLQLRFRGGRGVWFSYPKGTDADPERLPRGALIDVVADVKVDAWQGTPYVDLNIKDLRRQ